MKKILITILILVISSLVLAQVDNLRYLPIAETDDFWSPLLNPAALGFGNGNGLAYVGEDRDNEYREDYYTLFFNMEGLSYVFHRDGTEKIQADMHTLAIGQSIISPNTYFGVKYDWQNKYFNDGKWGFSGLWRPTNYFSLAGTAYDIKSDCEEYRMGISIRPLASNEKLSRKLTLSGDVFYAASDEDAVDDTKLEWQKPIFSLSSEVVPGVFLSGSYDLQNERIGANVSLAFAHSRIGNVFGFNDDNNYVVGNSYIHLTDYNQESIFNPYTKDRFYVWKLKGEITEQKSGFKIGPFSIMDKKQQTLTEILEKIEELKNDEHIKGIIFKNPQYSSSFAVKQELQAALLDFKSAGKKIIYYSENMTGSQYCLAASVADAIYLHKNGSVDLRGVSITMPYFKGLLDTIGVDVTNFQSHEYKTAFNSFSYDHMTDAERETYEYLLEGIFNDMKKMILSGRETKLKAPLDDIIDQGPYLDGGLAYDIGLVDYLIYEDELDDMIKQEFDVKKSCDKMPEESMQVNWQKSSKEKIAVIYAVGSIVMGEGKSGRIIGSITTAKAIKKAREDKSVKGIILRVDSGGGSAFASDVINREIELCHEGKNQKPVVASMSGVAGSGGYFISCNADKILAQSSTITGSIGVIGMWPSFERLYRKIYINWSTVKKGENADFANTTRQPKEYEIDLVKKYIDKIYNDFVTKVAQGRDMSKESVHKVAMGRVWTGSQALDRGLIDQIGGLNDAVTEIKKLADITTEIDLVDYSGYESKMELMLNMDNLSSSSPKLDLPDDIQSLLTWWDYYQQFKDEKAAMVTPMKISE